MWGRFFYKKLSYVRELYLYYFPTKVSYTTLTIGSVSGPWDIAPPNAPVIDNNVTPIILNQAII